MKQVGILLGILLILGITYFGYVGFQEKNRTVSPLVTLNDPESTYSITRRERAGVEGYQYYLIQFNPSMILTKDSEFLGNAVAISGSAVSLDQYLDKPVKVEAAFLPAGTSAYNGDSFYITSIQTVASATPSASDVPEMVTCTLDAKICPDGSSVGRVAPDCEFAACPTNKK